MKKRWLTWLLALCLTLGLAAPAAAASGTQYDVKNNVFLSIPDHYVVFTPENPIQTVNGKEVDTSAQFDADHLKLLAQDKNSDAAITVTTEKSAASGVSLTKEHVAAMKTAFRAEYEKNGYTVLDYSDFSHSKTVFVKATFQAGSVYTRLYYTLCDGSEVGIALETQSMETLTSLSAELEQIVSGVQFGAAPASEVTFKDVAKGAYYYDAVSWAVQNEITNGTGNGQFSPNATCTRGQVVTFLWRAAGEPAPKSTKNPFKDVSKSAYYYDAVLWAVEQGITNGTSKNTFSPNDPCTRGQVVTFLWRAGSQPEVSAKNAFRDVSKGAYYYSAVLWAVKHEITNGTGNGQFSPNAPCTRGQIVTFLYRAMA